MSMLADPQALAEALIQLDIEDCAGVMLVVLESRPELAPVLVNKAVPELTFAPSSILTQKRGHGILKSFNAEKGFGFIACPELHEAFGRDVYVHGHQIKGFDVGSEVNFAIALNKDNHPQAFDIAAGTDPSGKGGKAGGKGSFLQAAAAKAGWEAGQEWGNSKGSGGAWGKGAKGGEGDFMSQLMGALGAGPASGGDDAWGGDAWAGKGAAAKGATPGKGPPAVANPATQRPGFVKTQACRHFARLGHCQMGDACGFAHGDHELGAATGGQQSSIPGIGVNPSIAGKGSGKGPDVKEELGQGVGIIKSFSEQNGYGFIECPEVREMGYQDVFLHGAQMAGYTVGDTVSFNCFLNSSGKIQAKDLELQASGGGGKGQSKMGTAFASPPTGAWGGKGAWDKPSGLATPAKNPDVAEMLGELTGCIKSFNDASGYGFIFCAEVNAMATGSQKDVFLHHAQKGEFVVGDNVKFNAFLNKKGNVQAMDLQYMDGSAAKKPRMS